MPRTIDRDPFCITEQQLEPAYMVLHRSGELHARVEQALAQLGDCRACPRNCGADRYQHQDGICRTGRHAIVSSFLRIMAKKIACAVLTAVAQFSSPCAICAVSSVKTLI